ncbi:MULTISPECIES: type 4 pilus major pilin [Pandoraea]|uniref:Prepilin-type cleavage/methylation domain-containing protein n=1 Tax=Pandoraea capi TaxID=2508286 RepID=A0ABY6VUS8_9BURK|nr:MULTISPECIES: type 4 pilus major pilin [Pandoraea]MCI3207327.1 hypothetical protein [Pandoraea sp. LA3]MDN4585356.1 hypothetical protein [Pandoraea capi]VVD91319.1 prepilin-type cleavage/methylation domain-containing protein [Pandoraea capi]
MNVRTDASAIAQLKNKVALRMSKRRQRGVTLVELSVAVAVMGLIMAGAMVGVPRLMNNVKLSQEMKDWQMSALAVQNAVASGALPVTTTPQQILNLAIAEPFNRSAPDKLLNRFGGAITIEAVDGANFPSSGVKVKSTGYPSAQCQEFANKMQGLFATLTINGTTIKDKAKALDMTEIPTACTKTAGAGGNQVDAAQADMEFTIAG